ncbi:PHP-associated domain-containing protein [Neobacillus sp. Marseille-QA0830]
MLIETHLHTAIGSYDGAIQIDNLVDWLKASSVDGICITDHDFVMPRRTLQEIQERTGCLVVQGVEVTTDIGHILAYGLDEYIPGIHRIEVLRKEIDRRQGALVLAHPFRSELNPHYQYGGKPPGLPKWETVLERPIFQYVDALEACNGTGVREEEYCVRNAAHELGLAVTGGSDAHHSHSLGRCLTIMGDIRTEKEFIEAILAGECNGMDLRQHK